ncbi:hypothetical protein BCD67_03805 [Oscillatoriales cyanobacterium USR001]|nr:hypothetical protein BCD67_03805 [Oscillatoriales cyanobacterium USR001]
MGGNGTFNTDEDVLAFWIKQTSDKTGHKGVGLKRENNSTISLQFVDPTTEKRIAKACGEQFTEFWQLVRRFTKMNLKVKISAKLARKY